MTSPEVVEATRRVMDRVEAELAARYAATGQIRRMPDGTGKGYYAELFRAHVGHLDSVIQGDRGHWSDYLMCAVYDALKEPDASVVQSKLIDVMTLCVEWARDIELTEQGYGGHAIVCSEPAPALRPAPDLADPTGYYVPRQQLTRGGPVHGGFTVIEGGNYDQP